MKVSQHLDLIEQEIIDPETRAILPDRRILLKWYSEELTRLSSFEEFDFLATYENPLATLTTGKRNYRLPDEFPTNFVQSYDEWTGEKRYLCKLSNGTNENFLCYASPGMFFSRDMEGEANGCPTDYTIITSRGGGKEIWLGPPPDSTARTINGVYIPTNWDIDDEDEVPALPGNNQYLKHAVLARSYTQTKPALYALNQGLMKEDYNALIMSVARNRAAVTKTPRYSSGRNRSGY